MNGGKTKHPTKTEANAAKPGRSLRERGSRGCRPVLIFASAGFNIGAEELSL